MQIDPMILRSSVSSVVRTVILMVIGWLGINAAEGDNPISQHIDSAVVVLTAIVLAAGSLAWSILTHKRNVEAKPPVPAVPEIGQPAIPAQKAEK